jgi:hypothetical protein
MRSILRIQRSIDTIGGGPDAKKARWSPNSSATTNTRDAFANYGYGPQSSMSQNGLFNNSPPTPSFGSNALYSTPSIGVGASPHLSAPQLSPNLATAAFAQQQAAAVQQQQGQNQQQNGNGYGNFSGGYNMLGMGLPSMGMLGGFPYAAGNFNQVCASIFPLNHLSVPLMLEIAATTSTFSQHPRCQCVLLASCSQRRDFR